MIIQKYSSNILSLVLKVVLLLMLCKFYIVMNHSLIHSYNLTNIFWSAALLAKTICSITILQFVLSIYVMSYSFLQAV